MYITLAADLSASGHPGNGGPDSGDTTFGDLFACLMGVIDEAEDRCDLISLGSVQSSDALPDEKGPEDSVTALTDYLQISPSSPIPDLVAVPAAVMEGVAQEPAMRKFASAASLAVAVADTDKHALTARKESAVFDVPFAESEDESGRAQHGLAATEPLPANASLAEVTVSILPASVSGMTPAAAAFRPVATSVLLPGAAGTAQWQHSLSQQISAFIREGVHYAELRLQPESLGPIQVSLRMSNEQMEISFIAPHAQTREVLESALPLLRQSLSESGLALGESQISGETSDASLLFYDREKQPPRTGKLIVMPENIPLESLHTGPEYGLSCRSVNIFV